MDQMLRALAEPRRVEILRLLKGGELAAGEVARHFDVTRPAISQHLRVLVDAGLIRERRDGTRRLYRLHEQGVGRMQGLLSEFWDPRLARFKRAAESAESSKQGKATSGRLPRAVHRRKP